MAITPSAVTKMKATHHCQNPATATSVALPLTSSLHQERWPNPASISYQQRLKCWSVTTINEISCLHHPQQLLHFSHPSSSISTKTRNYHHQNLFFLLFCPSKPNQPLLYLSLIVTKRDKHTLIAKPTLEAQPWGLEGRNKPVEKKMRFCLCWFSF